MNTKRERRIERITQRLIFPRLQVSLILLITALAAFLTSFILLSFGVLHMGVRYPVATAVGYLAFLFLLGLWVSLQRGTFEPDFDFLEQMVPDSSPAPEPGIGFGGGGDFSDPDSGGSWDSSTSASSSSSGGSTSSGAGVFDIDLGEEGCLVILVIIAAVGGLLATFYVIYIAPALLAEILVDGLLVAGLYKRVQRIEERHWLRAAVRKTALPALLAVLFFTIAGYSLQTAIPNAHTIGEAWQHLSRER